MKPFDGVWIWGIGDAGKFVTRYFDKFGFNILGIIDNNEKFVGQYYHGYQIYQFDSIKSRIRNDDLVLCCCSLNNYEAIKLDLKKIHNERFMHFYEYDFSDFIYAQTKKAYITYVNSVSRVCSETDFDSKRFDDIAGELGWNGSTYKHRKLWEWVFIISVLRNHGMIKPGKRGLGFAVGVEPLPSFFASNGVDVLASDLNCQNDNAIMWASKNQNILGNKDRLWYSNICTKEQFNSHVSYRDIDMNYIPIEEHEYDFCWSSCAIEHIGSLDLSKTFLKNMLSTLRSGGVAIHTTEFNLSSNKDTIKTGESVIFRRRDLEEMRDWFVSQGHLMALSFGREKTEGNSYIDIPPFTSEYRPYHLTLVANGFVETSFGIVVIKDGLKQCL